MDTSILLILLTFSGKILYDIIVCSFIVSLFSFCFIYIARMKYIIESRKAMMFEKIALASNRY